MRTIIAGSRTISFNDTVEMAEMADALIAIWDGVSKGNKHMIDIAKQKNLNIYTYCYIIKLGINK